MQDLVALVSARELMTRERGGLKTGTTQPGRLPELGIDTPHPHPGSPQEGAWEKDQKARFALAPKTASYWNNI